MNKHTPLHNSRLFLFIAGFALLGLITQSAHAQQGLSAVALPAGDAIVIDGAPEAAWDAAPSNNIAFVVGGDFAEPTTDFSGSFKLLYDAEKFYVLVDVVDDILAAYTEGGAAWRDDAIELFFDFGMPGGEYDDNTYQIYFRSQTDGEFYWGANSAQVEGATVERAHTTTDVGYQVEFAIYWADYGVDPANLERFTMDINVNDADINEGGWPPSRILWNNDLNDSAQTSDNFGLVMLHHPKSAKAVHVDEAIAVDGEMDEAWAMAAWQAIDMIMPAPWAQPTTPFSARYKVTWDADNLYVLVDVVDDVLATYTEGGAAWRDDALEVFMDFGEPGGEYDENTYQVYFRSETDDVFYWGASSTQVEGATVTRAHTVTADGYMVEFALSWSDYGVDPMALGSFGFDINVNDADINEGGWAPSRAIWNNTLNNSSNSSDFFGTIMLSQAPEKVAGAINVAGGIAVDGEAEDVWDSAAWNAIDYVVPPDFAEPVTPFSGQFKAAYDATNLYILVDVVDDVLAAYTEGGAAWRDDAIELFLDFAADGGAYDAQTYQIYFRSLTDGEYYWGANSTTMEEFPFTRAHMLTDEGYQVEIALPWADFGIDPVTISEIGFDINVNDADINEGGWPPSRIVWNNTLNDSAQTADNFGKLALLEETVYRNTAQALQDPRGIVVDGVMEDRWAPAPWQEIMHLIGAPFDQPDPVPSGRFKVVYDATSFYLLVDVVDDVLDAYTEGGAAWRDDAIELFFDFEADGGDYDEQTYQIYFRSQTDGEYYWGASSTTVEDPNFNRAHTLTDEGYMVEFSMDWADFGVTAADLESIGFDININDADTNSGGWPPARIVWNNTLNDSAVSSANFGLLNMVSRKMANVVQLRQPVVIDGEVDEVWAAAPANSISYRVGSPFDQTEMPLDATFQAGFDADNLYVLVNVVDDVLDAYTEGGAAWRDDAVEFFFDLGDLFGEYDDDTYQIYFRSQTDGVFYWGAKSAQVEGATVSRAHTLTDDGYIVEFALSWADFGVDPFSMEYFGMDVNVNDADANSGGWPPSRIVWSNELNNSATTADNFGIAQMVPLKTAMAASVASIAVDGQADSAWDVASWYAIDNVMPAPWAQPVTPFGGRFKAAYTADNLYLLIDVTDDILAAYTEGGAAWRDDAIELFFDFAADGGAYDEQTYQVYFRSETDGEFYWGASSAQVESPNFARAHMMTDTGYQIEFALAWADFGIDPAAISQIGFDINLNDGDLNNGGWAPTRVLWNNLVNNSSNSADLLGFLSLESGAGGMPAFATLVGAVDNGDGTYTSPWLGKMSFSANSDDIVWVFGMGWVYAGSASSADGMWLYSYAIGAWVFTGETWFPALYTDGGYSAVFYHPDFGGWIYDYDNDLWTQVHP